MLFDKESAIYFFFSSENRALNMIVEALIFINIHTKALETASIKHCQKVI